MQKPIKILEIKLKNPEGSQYKYQTIFTIDQWQAKDGGTFLSLGWFRAKENLNRLGINTLEDLLALFEKGNQKRFYVYQSKDIEIKTWEKIPQNKPVQEYVDINDLPF